MQLADGRSVRGLGVVHLGGSLGSPMALKERKGEGEGEREEGGRAVRRRRRERERKSYESQRSAAYTWHVSYLLGLRPRLRGRDGLGDYPRRAVVPPQPTKKKKKKRDEERDLEQRVFVAGFGMVLLESTLVAFLFFQSFSFAWC